MANLNKDKDRELLGYDILQFIRTEEDELCNDEDIFSNGFMDREFADEKLPAYLFDELIENYKSDPCIMILKENNYVEGIEVSKLAYINYEEDTIEVGSKELEDLKYDIVHDKNYGVATMEWMVRTMMCNEYKDFPMELPCDVHIDRKKKNIETHYQIQSLFMSKGYRLLNPTELERKHCSTYGSMCSNYEERINDEPYNEDTKVFISYRDCGNIKRNYVAMQFNPTHPLSLRMIRKINRRGLRYEGIYEWNGREYVFSYNLEDKRYRIHSDMWQRLLGFYVKDYEIFDLVSDHDFIDVFTSTRQLLVTVKEDEFKGSDFVCVEPFVTDRMPDEGYSAIGPWEGVINRGVSKMTYVPYLSFPIKCEDVCEYIEVTNLVRDTNNGLRVRSHCDKCIMTKSYAEKRKCECDERLQYKLYPYENMEEYYVIHNPFRVFCKYGGKIKPEDFSKSSYNFMRFEGLLNTYPSNGKESIVYSPQFINLMDVFPIRKWQPKLFEFAPLTYERLKKKYDIHVDSVEVETYDTNKRYELKFKEMQSYAYVYILNYTEIVGRLLGEKFRYTISKQEDGAIVKILQSDLERFEGDLKKKCIDYEVV